MKYIPFFMIIIVVYIFIGSLVKNYKIPDEAIRIRVIANSNSKQDQLMKKKIKNNVEKDMYKLLKDANDVDEARKIINSNLNLVDRDVKKTIGDNNYKIKYDINYGKNYFPNKKYKGVTYKSGYYESLVITLGKGQGDNWWCVLFPPICLMEAEESSNVEYTTLVKRLVDKYL